MRRWTMVAVILLLAASPSALPQAAGAQAPSTAAVLTLEAGGDENGVETLVLTARLIAVDGEPISGQRIAFLVEVDFPGADRRLGADPLLIGSKTTDATGRARVKYVPTWTGEHHLIADAGRVGSGPPVTGTLSVEVDWLPGAYTELPRSLQPLEVRLIWVVGAAVIAIWIALALITVQTTYGIAHAGGGGVPPPSLSERQGPR